MAKSTRGYCKYCGKEYTRTGMLKHLQSCKKRMEVCENSKKMSAYYELMLYGTYNKDYWLIIQIKENATLECLDQFIRDIWVECCGHLSAFDIEGVRYEQIPDNDFLWGKPAEDMSHKLKEVLEVGMEIGYEYDFGSTTELTIKVVDFYKAPEQKENVTILSRNNPIQFTCSVCGKNPAVWIDPIKMYNEDPFWCEECLEKYENGELDEEIEVEESGYLLPVTNSPRMGVCGYEGSDFYPDQFEPDDI